MKNNSIETLVPLSPLRFKRCGECGCPEHGGANGTGHATNCSKYNHLKVNCQPDEVLFCNQENGQTLKLALEEANVALKVAGGNPVLPGQTIVHVKNSTFELGKDQVRSRKVNESEATEYTADEVVAAREYWEGLTIADLHEYHHHYTVGTGAGSYSGVEADTTFKDYLVRSAQQSSFERAHDL